MNHSEMAGDWLEGPPWQLLRAKAPRLNIYEKTALIVLWQYARSNGEAWPTLTSLAEEMPANLKTARAAVNSLVDKGLIIREPRPSRTPHYFIQVDAVMDYLTRPTESGPTENGMSDLPNLVPRTYRKRYVRPTESGTRPNTSNLIPVTSYQDHVPSAAEPTPKRRRSSSAGKAEDNPWDKFETQEAFTAAKVAEYRATLGENRVLTEIARALNHTARKKYTRMDLYVGGWLDREAERVSGGHRNGTGPRPQRPDLSDSDAEWFADIDARATAMAAERQRQSKTRQMDLPGSDAGADSTFPAGPGRFSASSGRSPPT